MNKSKNDAGLEPEQWEELKQALLDLRTELTSRRSAQLKARADLSIDGEVEDEGEAAVRANNEDTLVSLAESERARLIAIDHALNKFDDETYGLDEETGEPIGYRRLKAIPWARYAATTQEQLDRF